MTRVPQDTISQRELTLLLKVALDRGRTTEVERLAGENPRSIWSRRVVHNLGVKRVRRLTQVIGTPPEHVRAYARASAGGVAMSSR